MSGIKINSLEEIKAESSGLKDFVKKNFQEKLKIELSRARVGQELDNTDFIGFLNLFLLDENESLEQAFQEKPEAIASSKIKALKLLNLLRLGKKITATMVFPFPAQDLLVKNKLANELADYVIEIYFSIKKETSLFEKKELDLWLLLDALPEIFYYLAKKLLVNNQTADFGRIKTKIQELEKISESYNSELFEIEELNKVEKIKLLYLKILLSLRQADQDTYKLLEDYHKIFKPDLEKKSKLVPYSVESFYKPEELLVNWTEVLDEANQIQKEIETLAGILPSTCDYFSCSDCCSFTFPVMSYTEFLYLRNWMKENNLDENLIKEKSEKIQEDYESKFSERLRVIDKSETKNKKPGSENPYDYKFSCPFLTEEGRCSCHAARPLLCRGFGTATNNGLSIKTCNYYLRQYQYNSSPENERYVFDMRSMEMLIRASDKYFYEQGESQLQEPKGTIVAWFSN